MTVRWLIQAAAVLIIVAQVASGRGSVMGATVLGCVLAYLIDAMEDE